MTKRHAKPTAAQLLARIYRQNLEFKRMLLNQMAHIRLDIVSARREDRAHMKTLIDHCARLLREKETLQKRMANAGVYRTTQAELDANLFIARPQVKKPWIHTGECNSHNALRLSRGDLPQCICGAIDWKEKLAADVYNADFKP